MPHSTTGSITLLKEKFRSLLYSNESTFLLEYTIDTYKNIRSLIRVPLCWTNVLKIIELGKQISFCLNLTMNVSLFSRHRPNMKDNNSGEWLDIKVFLLCIRQLQAVSSIENFYNISMKHYIRCAKVCMEANVNKVVSNKYSKLMGGSNNIYNYKDWLPFWTLCRNSEAFRTFPIKSILISFWCICINL